MAKGKTLFLSIFLIPTFVLYAVFFIYPNFASLLISLYSWKATSTKKTFIGLGNFKELFSDPLILKSLVNNLYMSVSIIGFCIIFGLLLSGLVTANRKKKLREVNFYRSVFFFPNLMSIIITSILWVLIYSPSFGLVNPFLKAIGLESWTHVWLGESGTVKLAIVAYQVWSSLGFYFVIFLSAISSIPVYLYEASSIDGANGVRAFFKITLPLISNTVKTLVILGIASTFNTGFAYIKVMTDGGPNYASEILPTYMHRMSFLHSKFGYGAAIGVLIFVLTMVLYLLTTRLFARGESYEY